MSAHRSPHRISLTFSCSGAAEDVFEISEMRDCVEVNYTVTEGLGNDGEYALVFVEIIFLSKEP
jgi:hypothetical protein